MLFVSQRLKALSFNHIKVHHLLKVNLTFTFGQPSLQYQPPRATNQVLLFTTPLLYSGQQHYHINDDVNVGARNRFTGLAC